MKKIRYTLVSALMAILLVVMASCSQNSAYLQSLVDEMRREFPVPNELADGVVLTNITGDDDENMLLMEFTVTDNTTREFFRNSDYFSINARYTLSDSQFARFKEAMKEQGFGMKFVAKDENGASINTVTIGAADLDNKEPIGVVVRATAMAENAACPIAYGDGSVLERAEAQGDSTIVYYIEGGEAFDKIDFAKVEDQMKRQMVNSLAGGESNKQMRHDMGISYKYVYKHGDKVYHSITISPGDWLTF